MRMTREEWRRNETKKVEAEKFHRADYKITTAKKEERKNNRQHVISGSQERMNIIGEC